MENFCYIDSICYQLKYFNRISMILSSICHVIVDHCQQRCHLQFTMVCAETEIGLGLDSENNNIRICITSGVAEIKKSRKRIFFFFNLPKSRVEGFEKLFIKKLWPHVPGLCLLGIGGTPYTSHKIMAQKPNFYIFDFFSETTSRWCFILCWKIP